VKYHKRRAVEYSASFLSSGKCKQIKNAEKKIYIWARAANKKPFIERLEK